MSGARKGTRLGSTPISFTYDGRRFTGLEGDTAASALLANGVRLMGRSVKYRRLRGVLTCGAEEPSALFTVGRAPCIVPNVPATTLQIYEGLDARSQNRWPSLTWDTASLLRTGSAMFGAGFYYKTFIWPNWKRYEGMIRRLAGLGAAPGASDIPTPHIEHLTCDVLVVGAGAAGLTAARTALRAGQRVVLCEREPVCGGDLEFEDAHIDGKPAMAWVHDVLAELRADGARVLTNTAVLHLSEDRVTAHEGRMGEPGRGTVYQIRARRTLLAAGAVERPIAFIDNDKPGVMLLGAAEHYAARYGARAGDSVVLFGNHDRLYAAARRLRAHGMRVAAIIDTRPSSALPAHEDLAAAGVRCLAAHAVIAATGGNTVNGARIAPLDDPANTTDIACDAILVSGGWNAASRTGAIACGAAAGTWDLAAAVADAHAAACQAAQRSPASLPAPQAVGDAPPHLQAFWRSPAPRRRESRQFIDWQNDVTSADIRQAVAEGFIDIEHVKRYTTLGVGTDQGKTGGLLGAGILAEMTAAAGAMRFEPDAGDALVHTVSRARPPLQPASLGFLCGTRRDLALRPERRTPLHHWHAANGGVLETSGLWMRPRFYRANGDDPATAGLVEAARVRRDVGMMDGSTLGKIEIAGRDAAVFLDRLYLTKASTIRIGRSKYMVLLREDGMVLDDGIVLRLAEDRFLATVSSGHAEHVLSHLEFWRDVEFAGRHVAIADVTETWSVIPVAGPRCREVLREVLGSEWNGPVASLSHMQFADGAWRGSALRVVRASFSGELAFELHARPGIALPLWDALHAAGVQPYGLEALDILRVEKGYLVSSEMNGQATPQDLGMEGLLRADNQCIGRALLDRPAFSEPQRPRLVGLKSADPRQVLAAGAQLTHLDEQRRSLGYVTSAVYSPELSQWVGLALLSREVPLDAQVMARDPLRDRQTLVRVTPPVHVDPDGARMKS